jgi:hypothetical protein
MGESTARQLEKPYVGTELEEKIFSVWELLEKEKKDILRRLEDNAKAGIIPESIDRYLLEAENDEKAGEEYDKKVREIAAMVNEEIKQKFLEIKSKNMGKSFEAKDLGAAAKKGERRVRKIDREVKGSEILSKEPEATPREADKKPTPRPRKEIKAKAPEPGSPFVSKPGEPENSEAATGAEKSPSVEEKLDELLKIQEEDRKKQAKDSRMREEIIQGREDSGEKIVEEDGTEKGSEPTPLETSSPENGNGLSVEQAFKNSLRFISSNEEGLERKIDEDFKEGKLKEKYIIPTDEIEWDKFDDGKKEKIKTKLSEEQNKLDDYLKSKIESPITKEKFFEEHGDILGKKLYSEDFHSGYIKIKGFDEGKSLVVVEFFDNRNEKYEKEVKVTLEKFRELIDKYKLSEEEFKARQEEYKKQNIKEKGLKEEKFLTKEQLDLFEESAREFYEDLKRGANWEGYSEDDIKNTLAIQTRVFLRKELETPVSDKEKMDEIIKGILEKIEK